MRLAERRQVALLAALGLAVFLGSWLVLHLSFYDRHALSDAYVYETYGDLIEQGKVPYRDFSLEYPPAALPVFAIPSLLTSERDTPCPFGNRACAAYKTGFDVVMAICGLAAVLLVAFVLLRRGPPGAALPGILLVALSPLALGTALTGHFDLWPALLTAAALAALGTGHERLSFGVLAVAVAAKLYPALLLPLVVTYVWRRLGRGQALACFGIFAYVVALLVLPFLAIAPHGVWHSLTYQARRPLQIESLGAAVMLAAHQLFGTSLTVTTSYASQNLAGVGPRALAVMLTVLQIAALLTVWVLYARGPADFDGLLRSCAAAVVAFVAFGKVLSPQFLIWLVPLVALVGGRRARIAAVLFLLAMILTQLWFPYRYVDLAFRLAAFPSWLVVFRDLLLVALFVVLVWPEPERRRAPPRLVASLT